MEGIITKMSNMVTLERAKEIMGNNVIGPDELKTVEWIKIDDLAVPDIHFTENELEEKKNDYLLILTVDKLADGKALNIRNLLTVFGKDPNISEPCFYNQDWYDKEDFIDVPLKNDWILIRKKIYEDSRAIMPNELMEKYSFPQAVTCVYAFFVAWLTRGEKLWYYDFVWCCDTDHNGDRIYVGKYHDIDGVNKNGFSIHRHLALRPCYGCID